MKKLSLIMSMVIFVNYTFAKPKIRVTRSGSKDGVHYDYTSETHNGDNHTLTCLRPGSIICGWTSPPQRIMGGSGKSYSVEDLLSLADERIKKSFTENTNVLNEKIEYDGIIIKIHAKMEKDGSISSDIAIYEGMEDMIK